MACEAVWYDIVVGICCFVVKHLLKYVLLILNVLLSSCSVCWIWIAVSWMRFKVWFVDAVWLVRFHNKCGLSKTVQIQCILDAVCHIQKDAVCLIHILCGLTLESTTVWLSQMHFVDNPVCGMRFVRFYAVCHVKTMVRFDS